MKRVTKFLAALLILVLVIGVVPVQAATTPSLKKASKVLYLGGCKGKTTDGTKAKYYAYLTVKKVLKNYDSKTMDIKLESEDESICTVSNSKGTINAAGKGSTKVLITVRNKSTEKTIFAKNIKITVKKNADDNFSVKGIEDGSEYEVGTKLSIVMSRSKDNDYRKLTCDNADAVITKNNGYGSKYTVRFPEPGTYKFTAVTYQSSKYSAPTATKTFTVTVKGEAPTPTPTETPTPTVTPTPTTAPSKYSVKQTALDTFVISGVTNASDIKAKDINLYTMLIDDIKVSKSAYIKNVTANGTDVTVEMLSNMDADAVYYIELSGNTENVISFKAVSGNEMDIARIEVTNTKVLYNTMADLGLKYYNAEDIDITNNVKDKVVVDVALAEKDVYDAYGSGTQVYFSLPDKVHTFNITVLKGYKDGLPVYIKKENVAIVSYEPKFDRIIYTITTDDGVYMKSNDTLKKTFTVDDTTAVIEALFVYKDAVTGKETYNTLDQEGIDKVDTNNGTVMFIGNKSASGGYTLIPNNTGVVTVIFYKNGKDYATADVEIKAEKKVNTVTATLNKSFLNVNALANDSIEITVVVKDQYGEEMKNEPITISQIDTTMATGVVSFGSFTNGKLKVSGGSVAYSKEGIISAKVTCGTASAVVNFQVSDKSEARGWRISNPEISVYSVDTAIKEGDVLPQVVTISVEGVDGNYTVNKELIKFLGAAPSPALKASDFGVPDGTKLYLYTVQKDGQYLTTLPELITDDTLEIKLQAYAYQKKLEAGQYTISTYSLILGSTNAQQITTIGRKSINVKNNQPTVTYKFVKDKTTETSPVAIATDCYEFYIDGKKLPVSAITDADVAINGEGTSKLVKSVTITYNNTVYGDFQQKVTLAGANIIK